MKLVIGGAFQGKLEYAKKTFRKEEGWIDGRECPVFDFLGGEKTSEDLLSLQTCIGIHHFHEYIKRVILLPREKEADLIGIEDAGVRFADLLAKINPDLIVVSNELGYGIVPMERTDRTWRELTGRICTRIAANSEEVIRVVCGVGMKLK